jgi:outer membrane immunogenic protein
MKRILIVAAATIATLSQAFAADVLPGPVSRAPVVAPPIILPYNWTGLYIGANGGYGWSRVKGEGLGVSRSFDMNGPLAGGQIGFNYQAGVFVLGTEFDGQWANIKGTHVDGTDVNNVNMRGFATGRGRIGLAFDNVLVFGTGGAAYVWGRTVFFDGVVTETWTWNRLGWTAGGGVEIGSGPWSVKTEYLYVDFRETRDGITSRVGTHIARLGLNYRFGAAPVRARY